MRTIDPEDVLRFWFGPPGSPPLMNAEHWFKKDDAFDREIQERFAGGLEMATSGRLAAWRETPRSRLALVILLDQLSRNMFRGTPRAFAQDALAVEVAEQALAAGDDAVLAPMETGFLLMPLMHAEDLERQRRCVAGFKALAESAPPELRDALEKSVDYAEQHLVIIERFGRFPHRNGILGRATTPEEAEFLKQPGSSF